MSKTSSGNILAFIVIALAVFIGPNLMQGEFTAQMMDLIPGTHTTFRMLDGEGRRVLSSALERMAIQIEDDGLRENKIVNKSSCLLAIERTLHHRVGVKQNLGTDYPGLGKEFKDRIGDVPEFPQGRSYIVNKFRELAKEIR